MPLNSEAKKLLAETIRGTAQSPEKGLRERLLRGIRDEAERRYRLSLPLKTAKLDDVHRGRRERLEAWIAERARATRLKNDTEARERFLGQAVKEAAATLLNRLVLLRHLEAFGLSKPTVVTGGWNSKGYREFREFAPALCTNGLTDATEGYATLLHLVFDELAIDLPGLFGDVGLTRLFPIPASLLREVVERLDDRGLASAWTDDTTLGWVYQYWNDPDREALDAKINAGGKIEPHEIASKTQMFTERYMVEWLLQNSLGLTWLCMCRKHGRTADAESVLPVLEARRVEWRARREAGTVALDALMPIEGELEDHWKYFVPQPLPDDAIAKAPADVRSLKILDPACGSGHFLVIAFGLLAALYREEARHRGTSITDREIAESILENNLFGIDIDPRAIQIAAAALYLKVRTLAKNARPKTVNLVAPVLQLGNLPADDPAVVLLRRDLQGEVGLSEELTNKLLLGLAGVDYLGSLLKVDAAVNNALRMMEDLEPERVQGQGDIFRGFPLSPEEAKVSVLDKLELFLAKHSTSGDLGLRLDGEQLAAGVRFVRIAKEETYDVVVGNPPYQGLSKTAAFGYVARTYPRVKADLYAAFLERSLELAKPGGTAALLTMRGWMFAGQFAELRERLLQEFDIRAIGDFDRGAFDEVPNELLAVAVPVLRRAKQSNAASVALLPTSLADKSYDRNRTDRKRAAVLAHVGRHEFDPRGFAAIAGKPIVYWWSANFLSEYSMKRKLGDVFGIRQGLATGNDTRFLRRPWEVNANWRQFAFPRVDSSAAALARWVPYIKGAEGRVWIEPLSDTILWSFNGLEKRVTYEHYGTKGGNGTPSIDLYFSRGIAFSTIGTSFSAREHRYSSIFGSTGCSLFPRELASTLCLMNTSRSRYVLESLNPTIHFTNHDVERLPLEEIRYASLIIDALEASFGLHESAREGSVEFRKPGPSSWRSVQEWAQSAVDRRGDGTLPQCQAEFDPPEPATMISMAVGVALGRFGGGGQGILEEAPPTALPAGILFVFAEHVDCLAHPACAPLHASWQEHGAAVGEGDDLRTYLRKSFFDYHKKLYENRPIYFPLSSAKRSFVAFVSIHRWKDDTLNVLLADHLFPTKRRLDGELEDLRTARATGSNKGKAERRYAEVQKLLEELNDFIAKVTKIAEQSPPPPDDKTSRREVDARYTMDLDDGVKVNSAALWPLLEPQWKDPKKWWKELATAQGKKDYDWSHLAARYFPTRVRKKCESDPSLAVAHGCFWTLHPAKAYAWELRLQDEIRPEFTIDETGSDEARERFLAEHAEEAAAIEAAERRRREWKAAREEDDGGSGPLFEESEEPGDE